ncbi:MAG TPA: glycosyltransferase family 4 protein [Terriglobales bacterium]|nr:glycosyltransferase family 4 protein [Terriglobales bacterium]
MKILLVHNTYQQPGGEDVVFEHERKLLESMGHQVQTYCRSNNEVDDSSLVKRLALVRNTISNEQSRQQVSELLKKEKFDVAHIHNTFMVISPAIYAAFREAGVPVVQTLHNYRLLCPAATFYRDGRTCEECSEQGVWHGARNGCYRGSKAATATVALMLTVHRKRGTWTDGVDRYIALSDFARQKFVGGGLPAEKISVKPNFVHPDPGARSNGQGSYAAFVGRLSAEKGLGTLVAAWKILGNRVPLLIAGDGPIYGDLRKQAEQFGLSSITFCGRVPRQKAQEIIQGAAFAVFPSECYENFPMGVVESFASGVPVIASRLGALAEIVQDARTGLHFTAGSAEELAAKVEWAWTNPERMRELGRQARLAYEQHYTAERNYPLLMEIYQQAIGRRGAHA